MKITREGEQIRNSADCFNCSKLPFVVVLEEAQNRLLVARAAIVFKLAFLGVLAMFGERRVGMSFLRILGDVFNLIGSEFHGPE